MKSTVAEGIAEFLQFQNDEELEWQMLIQENERIATVRKCRVGKVFVEQKRKRGELE